MTSFNIKSMINPREEGNTLAPISVTQLNRQIRAWLENDIGEVTVIGELSNLSRPTSGHYYFTLKDASAQVRCVYFRNYHNGQSAVFTNGQQVVAQGKLSLYEARGDYQLIIQSLNQAGLGELFKQFELLKAKLRAKGLFEQHLKKAIPRFPACIGIITSPQGAALQDMLTTLARRFPLAQVILYGSEVQGKTAANQLVHALIRANLEKKADVLLLARGGGSIEDLWAFNDEQLATVMSESKIPIICGIGHETDFTIADFVADLRAATPTAAAEAATPNQTDLLFTFKAWDKKLLAAMQKNIHSFSFLLVKYKGSLQSPLAKIAMHKQKIAKREHQLHLHLRNSINQKKDRTYFIQGQLNAMSPQGQLSVYQTKLSACKHHLIRHIFLKINAAKQLFSSHLATLQAVSPLATLERGYAIAMSQNAILLSSEQVQHGDIVKVQLAKGILTCQVLDKN